jgi:hypothetical protein
MVGEKKNKNQLNVSFASDYLPRDEKELSLHMQVSLKIADNIKDLAA